MEYFVILSDREYSDYDPIYFMGDNQITKKELNKKGREVGDLVLNEFEKLPKRKSTSPWEGETESYNPETEKTVYSPDFGKWYLIMEKWIEQKGFKKLPENIPEINVAYSDIPHN